MNFNQKYGEDIRQALKDDLSVTEIATLLFDREDNYNNSDTTSKQYILSSLNILLNIHKFIDEMAIKPSKRLVPLPTILQNKKIGEYNDYNDELMEDLE